MGFALHALVIAAVAYPIHGAVMYGDPWRWIFKPVSKAQEESND